MIQFLIMLSSIVPGVFKHLTCRNNFYGQTKITRFHVPDDLIFWTTSFPDYQPVAYTSPHVHGQIWADPDIDNENFKPKWNSMDGKVNRVSHNGEYKISSGGYPLNSFGRTGLNGRGLLGRWGPNHAADSIVTRWKRNENGQLIKSANNKNILQMIVIQRRDNKKWAIPGGMVDPGENVSQTLKREFMEEALNSFDDQNMIDEFFSCGEEIYRGYVDDYRNTDNSWMETIAFNFHDENGDKVGRFKLSAGDDASNVKWIDFNKNLDLHANHCQIVETVANKLNAEL